MRTSDNRSCFRDVVHEDTFHSHTFPPCLTKASIVSSAVGRIDYHLCYGVKDDPQPLAAATPHHSSWDLSPKRVIEESLHA